jgi:hypothetical protein
VFYSLKWSELGKKWRPGHLIAVIGIGHITKMHECTKDIRKTIVKFEMHDRWKYNSSLFCWCLHKSVVRYRLPKSILLINSISSWDISRPLNLKLSYMACHVSFPYIFCITGTVFCPNSATPSPEMVYFLWTFWTTMQLFVIDWHH